MIDSWPRGDGKEGKASPRVRVGRGDSGEGGGQSGACIDTGKGGWSLKFDEKK